MITIKKLLNKLIPSKSIEESNAKKKSSLQVYDEHLTKSKDKTTFEQLVQFYMDGKKHDFPEDFTHKDKYFEKGNTVYEAISLGNHKNVIKAIKIMNVLDSEGKMRIEIKDGKVEITISIVSSKLGIGSGGGVSEFTEQKCEEFAIVLAHELFHAQNHLNSIDLLGIEEYKSIRNSKKIWTNIAWNTFDEYYACRKTVEQFNLSEFKYSEESIEKRFKYISTQCKYNDASDLNLMSLIEEMFYFAATVGAYVDVLEKNREALLAELNKSKKLFQEVKCLLNSLYLDNPLNSEKYTDMSCRLEQIYNSNIVV